MTPSSLRHFAVLIVLLAGCSAPNTSTPSLTRYPTERPVTLTPLPSETVVPSITPTPTITATATITLTAQPTVSPGAITVGNVERLETALILDAHFAPVRSVALSPDGVRMASGSSDNDVRLFETISGEMLFRWEHHRDNVFAVEYAPDGSTVVSGSQDRTVQIWDPVSGARITGVRALGEVSDIAFAPDGSRFATVGFYSAIGEVWQAGTGAPLHLLEGHVTRLRSVAYDPSGARMATGDEDGHVIVREAATGIAEFSVDVGPAEALTLAFSLDGAQLAVGTSRGEMRLFDVAGQALEHSWTAHGGQATRVLYTFDGSMIISCGTDGTIRFWDAGSYERIAQVTGHGAAIRDLALSRDGATFASGGDDWRVFIWRIGE
jgi:WD40 repeat protein